MSPTPPAQTRLLGGRYRLEESIGRGGMGTVWRGHDEVLGRPVAVKEVRFPAELGEKEQDELRRRTLREARATASLSHPNVVTTYDVVEENGLPYIIMELLSACSLSELLQKEGPLPPHRVAEIGLEMLGALELSHRKGVVHRDVKPGNVLINDDGRAILTDFGIATMAGDPALTSTGVVLGSPAYMSPERARGRKPGPEADMWSLGATLYAAVEGRPPYDGDNALGTLTAVISDPVAPPKVEGPLRDAILGLLAKDPAERISIAQARALLQRAAADRSGALPAPTSVSNEDLERAGHTTALPIAAAAAVPVPPPAVDEGPGPLWRDDDQPPADDRSGRRTAMVLLGLAAVMALLIGLGYVMTREDPSATPAANEQPSTTPTTSAPSETAGETQSEDPATSEPPTTAEQDEQDDEPQSGGVPAGYTLHQDPTGFRVAVPEGWQEERDGVQVRFRDPARTSRYLMIEQTDSPKNDAEADWRRQEQSVSQRLPNYRRISIDEVQYRDYSTAADWEFTFGERTHVLNRGVNTGAKGYAIYFSSTESQWDESESIRQTAFDTFQPAG
jgi:eukaryotic-like serine/threonine-protein kinase